MFKHAAIAFALIASTVAIPVTASAITCYAHSRTAYGYGYSPYRSVAVRIALRQCAIRTPRGLVCVITSCHY